MAVSSADGNATRGLKDTGRQGEGEKGRPRVARALLFLVFFAWFAGRSLAQDFEPLERAIRYGDSEQKRSALFEIKKIATEQASRIAIPALGDKDVMVRATAASAVVYLPSDEAARVLLPLLNDKQEFVRREAALALGVAGSRAATSALLLTAQNDKIIEVRDAAVVALGQIGDVSSLPELISILRKKPNEDTEFLRRSAARAIGQIARFVQYGSTRTITPQNFLPTKYKDGKDPNFSDLTVPGTDRAGTSGSFQNALSVLLTVLNSSSESPDTRREAAFALGMIGSPAANAVLTKFSTDPDPYLAEICKEALIKLP